MSSIQRVSATSEPRCVVSNGASATAAFPIEPACTNVSCVRSSRLSTTSWKPQANGYSRSGPTQPGSSAREKSGTVAGSAPAGSPGHSHTRPCRSTTGRVGTCAEGFTVSWDGMKTQRPSGSKRRPW
jgi:hypothetical protein